MSCTDLRFPVGRGRPPRDWPSPLKQVLGKLSVFSWKSGFENRSASSIVRSPTATAELRYFQAFPTRFDSHSISGITKMHGRLLVLGLA